MKKLFLILSVISAVFLVSCKKGAKTDANGNVVVTGNVTLNVDVMHHSWGVPNIPVYVKTLTTQWPGRDSTKYDEKEIADPGGSLTFQNLGPGDYVFYASGYDSVFQSWVIGYQSITLTNADAGKELNLKIFVSEIF